MTAVQIVGAGLMLLFLAGIFMTVLYARVGTRLLAPYWNRAIFSVLSAAAKLFGKRQGAALSLAGPLIVVLLIGFWAVGLTVAAALVVQPELGSAIRPSNGIAPNDFITALLVAGNSLSIAGGGDESPHTPATQILFLINSLIGASILSLVLSYLVQVYSALRERNALALTVDLMTDGTGDAAEMLARLVPGGDSSSAVSELGNLVSSLAATKGAHHFYPLLFYFRFADPLYAVSRFSFVLLDLTTLIDSALDWQKYGALAGSAPVASLRRGALLLLEMLDRNFSSVSDQPGAASDIKQGRQSYEAALRTLELASLKVRADGVERYLAARRHWEPIARRVAPTLGYAMNEVDRRAHFFMEQMPA